MKRKVKNKEEGVHPWLKRVIQTEIRGTQTRFDGFEKWINKKLVNVLSPNLAGVHKELAMLQAIIEDTHERPSSLPIIEKEIVISSIEKGKSLE